MGGRANPKLIGAFVVGAVVLAVVTLLAFGSTKFLVQRVPLVMYFTGDLSGLDVGAPIEFKGVRIGTVTDVVLRFDVATRTLTIPVHAEIEADRLAISGAEKIGRPGENLPAMIEQGLRARLASQSLLTGKSLIELDFRPDTPATRVGAATNEIEIPTIPSDFDEVRSKISSVIGLIEQAKLPELVADIRKLVNHTDAKIVATDVPDLVNDLRRLVNQVSSELESTHLSELVAALMKLVQNTDLRVDQVAAGLTDATKEGKVALRSADQAFREMERAMAAARGPLAAIEKAAVRADTLLTTANGVIEPGSVLHRDLVASLKEVAGTARAIRILADNLDRNPNSILFGRTAKQ